MRTAVLTSLLVLLLHGIVHAAENGRIAFSCEDSNGQQQICDINPDGTGLRQLTFEPHASGLPAGSPDGKRIAYTLLLAHEHSIIVVMNRDGSDKRAIADFGINPAWSVSNWIAYVKTSGNGLCGSSIWLVRPDGSNDHQLTCASLGEDHMSPSFSPDGSRLALVVSTPSLEEGHNVEAWVMEVGGGGMRRITEGGLINLDKSGLPIQEAKNCNAISWSRETGEIVLWCGSVFHRMGQIWRIHDAWPYRTQVTHRPECNNDDPSWSPDGEEIVFTRGCAGDVETTIWVVRKDGEGERLLTKSRVHPFPGHSTWLPAVTYEER